MRSAHNLAPFPVRLLHHFLFSTPSFGAMTPTLQSILSLTELITAIRAHQPALMSLSPQRASESSRDVTLPQIHTHRGQGRAGCVLKLSIISCFAAIGWLNIADGWKTAHLSKAAEKNPTHSARVKYITHQILLLCEIQLQKLIAVGSRTENSTDVYSHKSLTSSRLTPHQDAQMS